MRALTFFVLLLSSSLMFGQVGSCSPAQSQRLTKWLASPPNPVPPEKQKAVATRAQLEQVCVPRGQKAFLVSRGVMPPVIQEGGSPVVDPAMVMATSNGENWVMLRVSEQGKVSAAYVITEQHNLSQDLTSAFKDWKLTPATFKGAQVPVVFKLKMDFKVAE
jgi:hypothetical protein